LKAEEEQRENRRKVVVVGEIGLRMKAKGKRIWRHRKTTVFLLDLFRSLSNIWTERLSYGSSWYAASAI